MLKPKTFKITHVILAQNNNECTLKTVSLTLRPELSSVKSVANHLSIPRGMRHQHMIHSQSTPVFPALQGAWSLRNLENAMPPLDDIHLPRCKHFSLYLFALLNQLNIYLLLVQKITFIAKINLFLYMES